MLFTPVVSLVERLLQVKRQLRFRRELPTLDRIKCLILDGEEEIVDASHPSLTERLPWTGQNAHELSRNPSSSTLDFEKIWFRYAYGPANLDRRRNSEFRTYITKSVCYNNLESDGNSLPLNPW